jgi:RNA polymerase sigma-70 factor (ECF subfamily)
MEITAASPTQAAEEADERALIGRARTRDSSAFRELVDRHRDRAYGLALRILRSPADAEEVAQDAFVRAWMALPSFRGESSFATWIHRITARRALDRAEILRRRREREAGIEAVEGIDAEAQGGENDEARERAWRFERVMSALTETQRTVVTLFYYEGRSVEQVSLALSMPNGTVKTHLSRARATLRKEWLKKEDRR